LWRLLPWDRRAPVAGPGGPLWFPRGLQGGGRHDDPARYGCLYASEAPVSAVAEALAPFRGTGVDVTAALLTRAGLPLALAELTLADDAVLVDLDDPATLRRLRLRPSAVATNARTVTQSYAASIFERRPDAAGLRWWSTLEASLINVTLYDRALPDLSLAGVVVLTVAHPAVVEAAELVGLLGPSPR
jgi:hypothetical protein